ncbi:leukotriene-A4 hydrolase [Rhizoctonia solani AG-1 IA]|uniref:Leukotriene-A4 hydrolase n=1 Tax=Thanatephorus cucumeris (strain AG1-IA) TaxID=983506 RepID=L8WS80_THACA|nr:leukotriene-A4 hydrolase [Rhizoctonia solani AG-1 IA]
MLSTARGSPEHHVFAGPEPELTVDFIQHPSRFQGMVHNTRLPFRLTLVEMVTLDPATQSNYAEITTKHVHFDWTIDWKQRIISGSATHDLVANQDNVKSVIALAISLPSALQKGDQVVLRIDYSTTTQCTAIGWLDKEQTSGKKFDYLFSQCQAVRTLLTRWFPRFLTRVYIMRCLPLWCPTQSDLGLDPCALSRAVASRLYLGFQTYSANITSILPVLMSALRLSPPSDGPAHEGKEVGVESVKYQYNQPISIPSYLIAIASGNVVYKPFAPVPGRPWKTGVWTDYVLEAEKILTPYEFGVYDLLVLPPSFPYGGMGWTTYTERLLQRALHGPAERDFSYIIGEKAMIDALEEYSDRPKFQRLVIDYAYGDDPDDAYSSVPYEKGSNFLLYLERLLGGLDVFLPYARDYVNTFRGQSIRTDEWKTHLFAYFEKHGGEDKLKLLNSVDWQLPAKIEYDTTLAEKAYQLAAKWDESRGVEAGSLPFSAKDLQEFSSNQTVVFLERLQRYDPLPASHIRFLGDEYSLDTTMNAEIRLRWYALALSAQAPAPSEWSTRAAEWVVGGGKAVDAGKGVQGRMKFCRPTFRAINNVVPALAKSSFEAHKDEFHPIARRMIAKVRVAELSKILEQKCRYKTVVREVNALLFGPLVGYGDAVIT